MTREQAAEALSALEAHIGEHDGCAWRQVGICVYCTDHNVRLYQGDIPENKRTVPVCAPPDHQWDRDMGAGFYGQCTVCSYVEWYE